MSQTYHASGNLKTKTSSVGADIGVTAYAHDASKPHRLASATIGGESHKFVHDANGNIEKYDCVPATCDDRFVEWNGRNLPVRITVGGSKAGAKPTARDEFAYGSDGARYHRKSTHTDADDTVRTEHAYYVGPFEELLPRSGAAHTSIRQTRVTDAVRHVKMTTVGKDADGKEKTTTAEYVDYIHKDHLGSAEGVTGAAGARTRTLAHDPFGGRRKADWTAALTESEISALADSPGPPERGHTGHEHLDRTGLIHRGGRVYDPALGRFLSPDPLVGNPGSAQSWNAYSYVSNSPMSFVDPSGLSQAPARPGCVMVSFSCRQQGGGAASGGFGVESVVSTYRYRYVDVFVSARIVFGGIRVGGNGPGVLDGWWDFMDPFVEVYHQYVHRRGIGQVTSQVLVVGTPNITGWPMELSGIDFGYDDRVYPQTSWVHIVRAIVARWMPKKLPRDKPKESKSDKPKPEREVEKGEAKPTPKFEAPTNPPQLPPSNIPQGTRIFRGKPTEQYPYGYWKIEKFDGHGWQRLDPRTLKPGPHRDTHIPFPRGYKGLFDN